MSKTRKSPLFTMLACALACASTRTLQRPLTEADYADLKQQLPAKVDVTWSDGDNAARESALGLSIPGATASWTRPGTLQKREVPEAALRSIEWNSHVLGAGRGLLIGGLSTAVLFAVRGAASGSDRPCPPPGTREVFFCFSASAGEKAVLGALLGFLPGALIGLAVGAIEGSTMKYEFAAHAPASGDDPRRGTAGRGSAKFGEDCHLAEDCGSGLTCQAGRCLGGSPQKR